jgi:transcription-repair coupling factor (superfamily II helicase)
LNAVGKILDRGRRVVIAAAPEGLDGKTLAELTSAADSWVLHIARDDARMAALAEAVTFFAPATRILRLPAWDTVPYDRVSPNSEVSAQRMSTLVRLASAELDGGPRLLLTTVNAALQRLPSQSVVKRSSFGAQVGDAVDLEALIAFLTSNGFSRTGTVMEPGEFAVRGGIHDIFPAGAENPSRLDFFGDTLESVRLFDPLSQRTIGNASGIDLVPVSEVLLNEDSINRFRRGYRELFGAVIDDDPLYTSISEGRKQPGMEHWLPLFYEKLSTVFDYVGDALVTVDHLVEEARRERCEQIADFYDARQSAAGDSFGGAPAYKPIPPDRLFLSEAEWRDHLDHRKGGEFSPFDVPESDTVVSLGGRQGRNFAAERAQTDVNVFDALGESLRVAISDGRRAVIACGSEGSAERMMMVLADHGLEGIARADNWPAIAALAGGTVTVAVLGIEHGFENDELHFIGEQDVLGERMIRRRRSRRAESYFSEASQINPEDLVVHVEHGIGRYRGLTTIDVSGAPHDCLQLEYDGGDKLYVPVENIEVLSRYGAEQAGVSLDKLGGAAWQARKARLKERIADMADGLIKVAAERLLHDAVRIDPLNGAFEEFCAGFAFEETDDQAGAIEDVLADLKRGRPMDRLVCGDVGFGKTEVALRSAFAMAMSGLQVAVIAPTTLLSRQHFATFQARFAGLPPRVRQLSRLVSGKAANEVRAGIADGSVDIVIGTHALLSKRVQFKNLGLLIVDEEQHFGVAHKERLKELKSNVHVLTLTATPIPRTLQMAFSGVKELSLIATPPVDRLAVRTFVLPFDPVLIREAILREHLRGGQVFYVCPRIADLPEAEEFLSERVPEVRFATAHGRMSASELEDTMGAFYEGQYDVLISTTIIESGLDIPSANTMIVHKADKFGLSQLYQLRGRIGRSKVRAYAYFTLSPRRKLTAAAEKRLKVLQALDSLGAGFSLASHDLDIRGAGNLLGEEQSGHVKEVGFELYQQLLEEALAAARSGEAGALSMPDRDWSPQIALGMPVLIPDWYVADLNVRLNLYRRLAYLNDRAEIDEFAAELIDRFGALPKEVENLLRIVGIKKYCRDANIEKLDAGPGGASVVFREHRFDNPAGLVSFISESGTAAKLRPDHRLVYRRDWEQEDTRIQGIEFLVRELAGIAQSATDNPST